MTFPRKWLIFGSDRDGVKIAMDAIAKSLVNITGGQVDFPRYYHSKSFNYEIIRNELLSADIFQRTKVVIVYHDSASFTKDMYDVVESKLDNKVFLIVISEELKKSSKMRQVFTEASDMIAIHCYAEDSGVLVNYAKAYFRENDITYEDGVIERIVAMTSESKLVFKKELEKIALYFESFEPFEEKRLTHSMLVELVSDGSSILGNEICAMIVNGNDAAMVRCIDSILKSENVILILRIIQRYFLNLIKVRENIQLDPNAKVTDIMLRLKIFLFGDEMHTFIKLLSKVHLMKMRNIVHEVLGLEIILKKHPIQVATTLIANKLILLSKMH